MDYHQLTFESELAREQARQQRRREAGLQRGLSERLEGHTTPLSVGVGRSPLVMPHAVREALERAMEMSGVPTAPPVGVGVAPNVSSPSSGVPSVTAIRAATQDLPSPTFSPRQLEMMERIARGDFLAGQIDALLESVGLDNNQLTDYIVSRPMTPSSPPPPAPRGTRRGRGRPPPRVRGRGRGGVPPEGGGGDDDDGSPPGGGGGGGRRGRGRSTPPRRARMNQDDVRWICWPKMPVNSRWGGALPASRTPIPSPRSTRMEANPKSIAPRRVCLPPTRFKKARRRPGTVRVKMPRCQRRSRRR